MGGRLRKFGIAARKTIAPLVFAAMLPVCAPAHALPRKEITTLQRQENRESLQVYAHLRASYGNMISVLFCSGKRKELRELSRDIKKPKAAGIWLLRERMILSSARGSREFNEKLAFGSLFQNADLARSVYRSRNGIVEGYARTLSRLTSEKHGALLIQWIKKGNGDVLSLFDSFVSCRP